MRNILFGVVGLMMTGASAWAQPYFLPLGDLPTGDFESIAYAVSDDGRVVVGIASVGLMAEGDESTYVAFRWTREEGMRAIERIPGWNGPSTASDVSADGRVVVGSIAETDDQMSRAAPFAWTAESGTVALPLLPGMTTGGASAASRDGSVIVGLCGTTGSHMPTRWVHGKPQPLIGGSEAIAVTPDGAVVLGQSGGQAARWTEETGWVQLGILPGGVFSIAGDMTPDGSKIIGYSDSSNSPGCCVYEMFSWTPERGMLSMVNRGWPRAISADGITIVGSLATQDPAGPGFFREHGQTRWLSELFRAYRVGPPLEEYRVTAYGMTPDANTIVGSAWDSKGRRQAFIASIGPYCLVDWDHSGVINSQDLFAFLTSFFEGDGDFTGDGVTDSRDWFEFFNDWRFEDCF